MLFTSFQFIFVYLPLVFLGFFLVYRLLGGLQGAVVWLGVASVFFYGWWNMVYVSLLLASIVFNYGVGYLLAKRGNNQSSQVFSRRALIFSVAANLILLGYFKYANFFLGEAGQIFSVHVDTLEIILPLGISFFTFTQIAFLVDVYRGKAKEYNFANYLLFVTWFPHLIAGPVIHHAQMMPQFRDPKTYRIRSRNLAIGFALIAVGFSKKLLLADPISAYPDPVFAAAASGQALGLAVAWTGALAYTLQIYFDFSGYCDMAVGLSMLFGIKLPINFNSPYKAPNIIEFWRRWHMTLSQFLRDYLYISLGGNRHGEARRLINIMLTMLLGGLWHGANWTFIVWGGLHGLYLCINHLWQKIPAKLRVGRLVPSILHYPIGVVSTFLFVVVAWVVFRADSLKAAKVILMGMFTIQSGASWDVILKSTSSITYIGYLLVSMSIIWLFPNIYETLDLLERRTKVIDQTGQKVARMICVTFGVVCGLLLSLSLASTFGVNVISPFLYFQF
jgi:alginate O-acetyltransferase complex protein AlgI